MKSCNRAIVTALVFLVGCGAETPDVQTAEILDVGLVQASGTPPLGEAITPITGMGGDGAAVVTGVGTTVAGTTGPGAIRWHGGQWIVPYGATPGTTLANASCDVIPRADATALVEVVSSTGVLGSTVVPATNQNIVIRTWPFVGAHVLADGEPIAMRISPRDAATGAWTSAAQDMTVVGCAINAPAIRTLTIPVVPSISAPSLLRNLVSIIGSGDGASHVAVPLSLAVGQVIYAVRVRVADSVGLSTGGAVSHFAESLLRQDDNNEIFATVATAAPSQGDNTEQTVAIPSLSIRVAPGSQYWVALQNASGSGQSLVYRMEIDIQ